MNASNEDPTAPELDPNADLAPQSTEGAVAAAGERSGLEQALGRLDELPSRELAEHPAIFDEIHSVLRAELTTPDQSQ